MSLLPGKRKKYRDQAEDAELLKLVGAVLEGAHQEKRRGPLALLRQKLDFHRLARKHPIGVICAPIAVVCVVFLIGIATGTARQREAEALRGGVVNPGSGGPDSQAYSGSGLSTSTARSSGSGGGGSASGPVERRDIAKELIARVLDGDYAERSDIATGRFLRDFENQWFLLADVDREQLQMARRGKSWLQVRGPYAASEARLRGGLTESVERWKTASEALVRVVEEDEVWKLEFIRVY